MTETLVLEAPPKPREIRIREHFEALGGAMPMNQFALELVDAGIYSDEDLRMYGLRAVQAEARRALRKRDEAGLPFAGQTITTEGGAHIWMQRPLWSFEDYELNISELIAQRDECHAIAIKMASECEEKFGRAPSIDPLEGI